MTDTGHPTRLQISPRQVRETEKATTLSRHQPPDPLAHAEQRSRFDEPSEDATGNKHARMRLRTDSRQSQRSEQVYTAAATGGDQLTISYDEAIESGLLLTVWALDF